MVPRYPSPAIAPVIDACSGFGTVETEADEDGKMRATEFVYNDGVNDYLTLATAAAYALVVHTIIVVPVVVLAALVLWRANMSLAHVVRRSVRTQRAGAMPTTAAAATAAINSTALPL